MSTMRTPQTERPLPATPSARGEPKAPSRSGMWFVMIVALLAGSLLGYLLGRASASPNTQSVATTATVTRTVPPPAYATGGFVMAVTFDGGACMYNGPAEQPAGTKVDFRYTGTRGSSLILTKVQPGVSYEEAVKASFAFGAGVYAEKGPFLATPVGATHQELHRVLDEGLWQVGCTNHPRSGRQVVTATMLRVP